MKMVTLPFPLSPRLLVYKIAVKSSWVPARSANSGQRWTNTHTNALPLPHGQTSSPRTDNRKTDSDNSDVQHWPKCNRALPKVQCKVLRLEHLSIQTISSIPADAIDSPLSTPTPEAAAWAEDRPLIRAAVAHRIAVKWRCSIRRGSSSSSLWDKKKRARKARGTQRKMWDGEKEADCWSARRNRGEQGPTS